MAGGGGGETTQAAAPNPLAAQAGSLVPRRAASADAEFDITAMIDLVFMMNIYFMVTTLTSLAADMDLPRATHAKPIDDEKATVIAIALAADGKTAIVTMGKSNDPKGRITDPDEQVEQIKRAVQQGIRENKPDVVLRAEKQVRLRDVSRIAGAASKVEGSKLYVAVLETESK